MVQGACNLTSSAHKSWILFGEACTALRGYPLPLSLPMVMYCSWPLWSESHSVMSDSLRLHGLYSPWNSPDQNTGVGSLSLLQGNLPNPGIEPRSPALQADSLPGKPKNTAVGSLSLLQWIFPTQESNREKSPIRGERCGRPLNTETRTHHKGLFFGITYFALIDS